MAGDPLLVSGFGLIGYNRVWFLYWGFGIILGKCGF